MAPQRVEDAHERARAAGAAQRAIEQPQHRRRRRIEIDGETQRGVGDRHQQAGGHAVAARVADHDRELARVEHREVVVVAADLVRGAVRVRDVEAREIGNGARQQLLL